MKKIISLILTLALCLGSLMLLASCGAPKDDGAEISVYLGEEVYDFDPTDYYANSNQATLMSLLFEPLFKLSREGNLLTEGVAKKYKVWEDSRTIVIELRETHWSDEQRVTAADFVYAWRNILSEPTKPNPAAALLYDIENAAEIKRGEKSIFEFGAVASGTYELTVTYREGADYNMLLKNLASVATSPVRQDVYDAAPGYWTKVLNYATTNGPFKIGEVNYTDGSFTVTRNIGYHQAPTTVNYTKQVRPGTLVSLMNADGSTAKYTYSDIENYAVFYMSEASLADRAEHKDSATVVDALSTYTYVFNTDNPLFKNKDIRRALSMAIDRNAIASAIVFGEAATGFVGNAVIDTASGKSFREGYALIDGAAKLTEARAILNSVQGFAGMDKKFSITVDTSEESVKIAELVKTAWKSLGFDVSVKKVDTRKTETVDFKNGENITVYDSEIQALINEASLGSRNFDVIGIDWQMYSTDAFVALSALSTDFSGCGTQYGESGLFSSFGGWKNSEYNKLIKEAYEATDKAVRTEKLHQAEAIVAAEAPIVPLVFNQNFAFYNKDLSKFWFDGYGNVVFNEAKQRNYEQYLKG